MPRASRKDISISHESTKTRKHEISPVQRMFRAFACSWPRMFRAVVISWLSSSCFDERQSFVSQSLHRIEARRLPRRVDRRQEADDYGGDHDQSEIARQDGERKVRCLVDV